MRTTTDFMVLKLLTLGIGTCCFHASSFSQSPSTQPSLASHFAAGMLVVQATEAGQTDSIGDVETGMTLESLQGMALSRNPTLVQAQAQVDAARGAALQAGLPPNPNVGYVAEQIGVNGTAGELQGGYVSQEFVRGNKLGLSRAKYAQRVQIAETNLAAQRQRIENDVAIRFYQALASQRLIDIHQQTVDTAQDNVLTSKEMLNMGQIGEAEVLQGEIELRRESLKLKQTSNELDQRWRELLSFVGIPCLQPTALQGTLESEQSPLDWELALNQLLASSPQLVAAQQKIRHDEIVIKRELAEPIPNLTVQLTTGYNAETSQSTSGVNAGLPLPIFNRNQGTVRQARADLSRSYAEVERLQLELTMGLAKQFRDYTSAWQHVQEYEQTMLPKARSAVQILERSYKERRATWMSVLSAKRMLLDLETEQVDNLLAYQVADISIRGNLLMGGLTEPDAPLSGGHIDANHQPR